MRLTEPVSFEEARLARLRKAIDDRLAALLPAAPRSPVRGAMRHAVLSPGKRLRPLLTLLSAWRLGAAELAALDAACAVEMVHAASLIFDDLPCMDDTPERRGAPATHVAFGESVAILAGIGLLNHAYAVIAAMPLAAKTRIEMAAALAEAVGLDGLVGGQERDLAADAPSVAALSQLHHQKTGVLFLAAVRLGAAVAGARDAELDSLDTFATELGLAFQAADDRADLIEDPADRRNLAAIIGLEGARRQASQRLSAAKAALERGGDSLAGLRPYVDALLPAVGVAGAA